MRAEQAKLKRFRKDMPDHAAFVCAVCNGGMQVHWQGSGDFLTAPRASSLRVSALLRVHSCAGHCTCCWYACGGMCRQSGLLISREQGMCYHAGFDAPVFMASFGLVGWHR